MQEKINKIRLEAEKELQDANEERQVEDIRVRYLGKKGKITLFLRASRTFPKKKDL
jgi:Aminoacyl tRNA synthetase class II, N-terminal domain.